MIAEKQTENLVMSEGTSQESIGMSLDLESAQVLMQMLSKNLYSDSVGSLIRETTSNALDSHRHCNVDKPIIVFFGKNEGGNYEFSVEDFGSGLDDGDVRDIISKYGKSTKRETNNELGLMGLGFKSPLAYSSSFIFICRKNGMERKYMMYEGEDENTIDLLFETPTKEGNGVKIIVPVNYSDRSDFVKKIKEQLSYFENVYFDVSFNYETIKNDFVIHRGEHFQYSELASNGSMHLCLDNVYYPLDFEKMGIPRIAFPLALRFSLTDGIFPIPSRESIIYSKQAKETILKRIQQVSNFFITKYNSTIEEIEDVHAIYNYYNSSTRVVDIINTGISGIKVSSDVTCLVKYSTIKLKAPTLKGITIFPLESLPSLNSFILGEYKVHFNLCNGRISANRSYKENPSLREVKNTTIYIYSDNLTGIKKEYIKTLYSKTSNSNVSFIKKDEEFILGDIRNKSSYNRNTYYSTLGLYNFPKEQWRTLIKEYQYIISLITKNFVDLDSLVIPQSFIDGRKKVKDGIINGEGRRIKLKGEITGKRLRQLEKYVSGKNTTMDNCVFNLSKIHQKNHVTVYGKLEDFSLLDSLWKAFSRSRIEFVIFSEREIKHLEEIKLHNWIEINEFMRGENKLFKKIITAYLIKELDNSQKNVFIKYNRLKEVSTDLYEKIDILKNYEDKWYSYGEEKVYKAMLEIANNNNLFDESVYSTYKEVKYILEKLKFLNPFIEILAYYKKDSDPLIIEAICDLFKYYKHKVNIDKYKIVTNDDIVEGEITEGVIEQLID